nr:unnamed protein product [Callosobruchus chinensis]
MTSTKKLKGVSHVIFDLDGLILDTEKIYTAVANIVLGRYGKSLDLETKLSLMGFSGPDMAKRIVKIYQLPLTPEEYYEEVKREYQTVMPDCQLLPGRFRTSFKNASDISGISNILSFFNTVCCQISFC